MPDGMTSTGDDIGAYGIHSSSSSSFYFLSFTHLPFVFFFHLVFCLLFSAMPFYLHLFHCSPFPVFFLCPLFQVLPVIPDVWAIITESQAPGTKQHIRSLAEMLYCLMHKFPKSSADYQPVLDMLKVSSGLAFTASLQFGDAQSVLFCLCEPCSCFC